MPSTSISDSSILGNDLGDFNDMIDDAAPLSFQNKSLGHSPKPTSDSLSASCNSPYLCSSAVKFRHIRVYIRTSMNHVHVSKKKQHFSQSWTSQQRSVQMTDSFFSKRHLSPGMSHKYPDGAVYANNCFNLIISM